MNSRAAGAAPRQAGFTSLEVAVVLVITIVALGTFGALLTTTGDLVEATRLELNASQDQRQGMTALALLLRGMDPDSLTGTDTDGAAAEPAFRLATGMSAGEATAGEMLTIRWVARDEGVDGVSSPGDLHLVRSGTSAVLLSRVPAGGFRIRREGDRIAIELRRWRRGADGSVTFVVGETIVRLRNAS